MSDDVLRFEGVTKRYGRSIALDALSFRIPRGSLAGFVGPNGAGKTTAFSLVGGCFPPDAGDVVILGGKGFDPWRLKGRLGILPQDADLGDRHSPRELLDHLARLQGLSAIDARKDADRILDGLSLGERRDWKIGSLSHGMRRRVAAASALVGDPDLVLLDEPTAGLDPLQAKGLRDLLAARRPGQTIVVSSHHLDELERICDWVVMIDKGRALRQGPVAEVTGRGRLTRWSLSPGVVPLAELRLALPDHGFEVEGDALVHRAPPDGDPDRAALQIARSLVLAGIAVREVRRGVSLEQRFFDDTGA